MQSAPSAVLNDCQPRSELSRLPRCRTHREFDESIARTIKAPA